jgi:hypothetical protein
MSGGTFQNQQHHIIDIADSISEALRDDRDRGGLPDEYGQIRRSFSPETRRKMEIAIALLRAAYVAAHRVDWLLASDDGEDCFHRRWEEDMAKLEDA